MKWAAYHHAYIYCLQIFCCFFYVFCCDLSFSFSFLFLCHTTKRLLRPLVSAAPLHSRMSSRDQPTNKMCAYHIHTHIRRRKTAAEWSVRDPFKSYIYLYFIDVISGIVEQYTQRVWCKLCNVSNKKKNQQPNVVYTRVLCLCVADYYILLCFAKCVM